MKEKGMIDFREKISERKLAVFLLPLILSGLFQQIYAPVSTAVAGRYLSQQAVAVIGACSACKSLEEFLFVSMTTGFSFFINRQLGTDNQAKYKEAFQGALLLAGLFSVFGILLALAVDPVMFLANIPPEMQEEARFYLIFLFLGGGFWGFENLLICVIQGSGETRFPFLLVTAGVLLQTGVVYVMLSRLQMGVEAVSLAFLLNHVWTFVILLVYLVYRIWGRRLLYPICGCSRSMLGELLKNGMTKSLMMLLVGTGSFILQRQMNQYSVDALAGYTYAVSANGLMMQFLSAYATAAGIMSAQNAGAKNRSMFLWYNRKMLLHSLYWCLGFAVLLFLPSREILLYMAGKEASSELLATGSLTLRVLVCSYPLLCVLMICRNGLQSIGCYRDLLLFGMTELLMNLFLALLLIPNLGFGAACFRTAFIWGIPGIIAGLVYRKRVGSKAYF